MRATRLFVLIPVGLGALALPAFGGGIALYEIATPDVGLASAGFAARAQDASTLFKNPAGMSRLAQPQLQAGAQLLYADIGFQPDANTSGFLGTDDGGNPVGALPGGSVFYVRPVTEKLHFGIGTLSYFGLAADYGEAWIGRYYLQKAAILGLTVMPSVSYKLNERLSVGAGLNAMLGVLQQEAAINPFSFGAPDGKLKISDDVWGFGADVGVLSEFGPRTRVGVSYLSPVSLDFQDTPEITGATVPGGPRQIDLGMTVPQGVMVSAYHEPNDEWALMADFGWQQWTEFGKVDVTVSSSTTTTSSLTSDLSYQDTFHGALGTQYRLNPEWTLTGGFAYDGSAVDDANRTVSFTVGETYRIGAGAQWQVNPKANVGFGYEFAGSGDLSLDQNRGPLAGRVSGTATSNLHFFTANASWSF